MDAWLSSHDDQPHEKIAQMFDFRLGGIAAEKRIEKLDKAVHKARDEIGSKYAEKTAKAIEEAKKIITDAVKAAAALGWKAEGLANRNAYGL